MSCKAYTNIIILNMCTILLSMLLFLDGYKMKRKIYDKLLEWKQTSSGSTALLIDGTRRVGKEVTDLFVNYLGDLDSLFMYNSA